MKKLKLSVSTERFERKEDIIPKQLNFEQDLLAVEEFKEKVKEGYCFCHWFNTTKDVFSIAEKTKNNFDCANVVFVDVDDYDVEMKEFVKHLPRQPTVYYTTPSNGKNGKYRYRLCYLFNQDIKDSQTFSTLYNGIINSFRVSYPDYPDKDKCGGVSAQYMNGNGTPNCEVYSTDCVYTLGDFNVSYTTTKASTDNFKVSQAPKIRSNKDESKEFPFTDLEFKADFFSMSPNDLIVKYYQRYHFFDSTELEYNEEGYALIGEDYRQIFRRWYLDISTDDKGREHKATVLRKRRDGDKRRYYMYLSALIRKQIKPDITFEHLLYNLVYERQYFYDNSDRVLTNQFLMEKALTVINTPIEKISLGSYRKRPKYKIDREFCRKNGIKPVALSNMVRSKLYTEKIGELYDCNLSVAENLKNIRSHGVKVGKTKLYQFCKEMGLSTKPHKVKD